MPNKPPYFYRQSGAVPIREVSGDLQVLLVTTRKGRWIIPKGIVEPGWGAPESAAREAWEEAGARGPVSSVPLGRFEYEKWGGVCSVEVFVLEVQVEEKTWPDQSFRTREWLSLEDCVSRVDVRGLKACLLDLPNWRESSGDRGWFTPEAADWSEEEDS